MMIDSIRLRISIFSSVKNNFFFREKRGSLDYDNSNRQRVKQFIRTNFKWSEQQRSQGKYIPKYWTETNSFEGGKQYLIFEFSVPKFLQGHNLVEIAETMLPVLVDRLEDFCKIIQLSVAEVDILGAQVTMVAYCHNVPIAHLAPSQEVMKLLSGYTYRFRSKFRPEQNELGQITHLQLGNNTSHVTAYDKLPEIIVHARTTEELEIAKIIKNKQLPNPYGKIIQDTIRFELTLHNTVSVRQAMKKFYGDKPFYTLKDVFKADIAAALLKLEMEEIYNHPLKNIAANSNYDFRKLNDEVGKFIRDRHQDGKLIGLLEQATLVLHAGGWAAVRTYLAKGCCRRTLQYRIAELREIEKIGINLGTPNEKIMEYILNQFGIGKTNLLPKGQQLLFS